MCFDTALMRISHKNIPVYYSFNNLGNKHFHAHISPSLLQSESLHAHKMHTRCTIDLHAVLLALNMFELNE